MSIHRRLSPVVELGQGYVARRWDRSDGPALTEFIKGNAERLRPWMAWAANEPLSDVERARQFRAWDSYWRSGKGCHYGLFDATGQLMGGCALHRRVGPGGIDLGYWLGAAATGRGLATRAARGLADLALAEDDIDFVEISHAADNQASGHVAERIGATQISADASVIRWRLDASSTKSSRTTTPSPNRQGGND